MAVEHRDLRPHRDLPSRWRRHRGIFVFLFSSRIQFFFLGNRYFCEIWIISFLSFFCCYVCLVFNANPKNNNNNNNNNNKKNKKKQKKKQKTKKRTLASVKIIRRSLNPSQNLNPNPSPLTTTTLMTLATPTTRTKSPLMKSPPTRNLPTKNLPMSLPLQDLLLLVQFLLGLNFEIWCLCLGPRAPPSRGPPPPKYPVGTTCLALYPAVQHFFC